MSTKLNRSFWLKKFFIWLQSLDFVRCMWGKLQSERTLTAFFSIFDYEQLFLCVASKSNADFSHQSEQSISSRQRIAKGPECLEMNYSWSDLQKMDTIHYDSVSPMSFCNPPCMVEGWKWRPKFGSRLFCSPLLSRPTSLPPFPESRGGLGKGRRHTPISWTATIWYNGSKKIQNLNPFSYQCFLQACAVQCELHYNEMESMGGCNAFRVSNNSDK